MVDHPPSSQHSPNAHSQADSADAVAPHNTTGTYTDDFTPHLSLHLPSSLHHATYHRFNLNMPLATPMHLPRRPIHQYVDDSPLTHCGHWQAATVGAAFAGHSITAVYCSPALRCVQTAEEVVRAAGMTSRKGWKGIRIEPGLFEWMGWYSACPAFLTPRQLKDNAFSIDVDYQPLSEYPPLQETQQNWYVRSAGLVHTLLGDGQRQQQGNVLMVGHAGTHDTVTFSLLHGAWSPLQHELEEGVRHRLYSNYCGVARVKWDGSRGGGGWVVEDDSAFDMHNTPNEPYSFQLSYVSIERQRKQRERSGTLTIPLVVPMDSYLSPAVTSQSSSVAAPAAATDTINDLNFARTFGFLLDTVHSLSLQFLSLPEVSALSDTDMIAFVAPYLDAVNSSVSPLIPEFHRMAAACDGLLLHHTLRCFVCVDLLLRRQPQLWSSITRKDKNILSWAILLHDVAKVMKKGADGHILRDPIHPFNSAIVTARIFARLGFSHSGGAVGGWQQEVEEWVQMVQSAIVQDEHEEAAGEYSPSIYPLRHDNSVLPAILLHLDHLFGTDTLMTDVTRLVLLHQSIPFIAIYPPASPLTDDEVLALLPSGDGGVRLLRLLGWLHVVDSGSYQINRPELQAKYVREIEDKVEQLMRLREEEGVAVIGAVDADYDGEAAESVKQPTDNGGGGEALHDGADAVVLTAENASLYGVSPQQLNALHAHAGGGQGEDATAPASDHSS